MSKAGWYPQSNGQKKYFDGERWTDEPWQPTPADVPGGNARPWFKKKRFILPGVLIAFVAIASMQGQGAPTAEKTVAAPSKYDQTWTTSYANTTCTDFTNAMSPQQRWAASADMLSGARNKGDGGTGLPPDVLITTFMGGIDTACVVPTMPITDVAVGLYLTERARFRP